MKLYKYTELPCIGPEETDREGTLFDLLSSMPYLLSKKRLPPLVVLNGIFNNGCEDTGMSGGAKWVPFQISNDEYSELVKNCTNKGYSVDIAPSWVKSRSDFLVWEFELDYDVPSKRHKELSDNEIEAKDRLDAAISGGAPEEEVAMLHLKTIETGTSLSDFINEYLQR